MKTKHVLIAGAFGLTLSACSDRLVEAPPLGDSVQRNMAAQVVNPKPASTDVAPPLNGERDALALTRYEKGKVLKPQTLRTSETRGSGGGGSSGDGGGAP